MLRINLLPPYIYAGSTRNKVLALWLVIIALVAAGLVFWKVSLDNEAARIAKETQDLTPRMNDAQRMQSQADDITQKSAAIRDKADFVNQAVDYTRETYPRVVNNVAMYTLRGVLYDGLTPQGQTITIPAYAPDLATVGHYMMAMSRNPEISNVAVTMNSIPPFPTPGMPPQAGQQATGARPPSGVGHNFIVTLTLNNQIPPGPTFPKGAAPQAAGGGMGGGMMGRSGMPGGMSGGMTAPPMGGGMTAPPMGGGPPMMMSPGMAGPPAGAMGGPPGMSRPMAGGMNTGGNMMGGPAGGRGRGGMEAD